MNEKSVENNQEIEKRLWYARLHILDLQQQKKQEWEQLKERVRHKSAIVSTCKNEQTDKEFDDAIAELMEFEKLHGIEEKQYE